MEKCAKQETCPLVSDAWLRLGKPEVKRVVYMNLTGLPAWPSSTPLSHGVCLAFSYSLFDITGESSLELTDRFGPLVLWYRGRSKFGAVFDVDACAWAAGDHGTGLSPQKLTMMGMGHPRFPCVDAEGVLLAIVVAIGEWAIINGAGGLEL